MAMDSSYVDSFSDFSTTSSIDSSSITTINIPYQYELEFEDTCDSDIPNLQKIKDMSKEYPALKKAFENLKTIYQIVNDDYESKKKFNKT